MSITALAGDRAILGGRPFDRAQAADAGLTSKHLTALVASGRLVRVLHGVYLDAAVPDDVHVRAACLQAVVPPGVAVSRLTAAWLWGADGRAPDRLGEPLTLECTVTPGRQAVRRHGVRGYVAPLEGDTCELDGVLVTTPARTVLDLLRWHRPHLALGVADSLSGRGLVTPDLLVARVEDFAGTRGIRQARYLASLVEPLAESMGESWLRLRIADAGFPRPVAQVPVRDASGRIVFRLDLGWPDLKVALEYDGEAYHSTPEQRARDAWRRGLLEEIYGWRLLVAGRGEVLGPSLDLERAVGDVLSMSPRLRRRR